MSKKICNICGDEIEDFGAVSFSQDEDGNVKEIHLCKKCSVQISGGV